jgi:integrating conjugative element relaxase (TIGR03760 family)
VRFFDGALLAVIAASSIGLLVLKRNRSAPAPFAQKPANPATTTGYQDDRGRLRALNAASVFEVTAQSGRVRKICDLTDFSNEAVQADVLPLLHKLAEFVQLLPASESHHHAQPGGLLIHLLECAEFALTARKDTTLPLGETPERQAKMAARWTYGVLLTALLHDIGKPLADLSVQVFHGDSPLGIWTGMAGPINLPEFAVTYEFSFREDKDYQAHKKLPIMLLQQLVPLSTLGWLSQDDKLMRELTTYLSGDEGVITAAGQKSELERLAKMADGKSVQFNLMHGPRTRFAVARTVPLIERLLTGLSSMLAAGDINLNRPSAAGFVDPDGEHIWLLVPRVANDLRSWIDKNENRLDDKSGLPTDNRRFYDTFAEYGKCVKTESGRAVWKFKLDEDEWHPTQTFSGLKFRLADLFKDKTLWPAPYSGTVELDATAAAADTADSSDELLPPAEALSLARRDVSVHEDADRPPPVATDTFELESYSVADLLAAGVAASSLVDETKLPAAEKNPLPAFLPNNLSATGAMEDIENTPPAAPRGISPRLSSQSVDIKADSPLVQLFLSWLQDGVVGGNVLINESSALVHFVAEGMLLATPGVFQRFAQDCQSELAQLTDPKDSGKKEPWRKIQLAFQKSGYVCKAPPLPGADSGYLHAYTTAKMGARALQVFLLPKPQALFSPVPPINPMIVSKLPADVKTT